MFKREFDVFLAYHGTYGENGSRVMADKVYERLIALNYKVFYFPRSGRDTYKANIIDVMKSRTFLLVSNRNIKTTPNGHIDFSEHYELATEIDAFYALTQLNSEASVQDAKVLVVGDYEGYEGEEAKIHELFANRVHSYYKEETGFSGIEEWLNKRIGEKSEAEKWSERQTTNEVLEVFAKRSSVSQKINLPKLITTSKKIRSFGISNNQLTIEMNPEAIKFAISRGASVEILFLDPKSDFTAKREKEEGKRAGDIAFATEFSIRNARNTRDRLENSELQANYRLFTYELEPRMNVVILDDYVILQYYANKIAGTSNPTFLIERQEGDSPLYDFCVKAYEHIKSHAIEMSYE